MRLLEVLEEKGTIVHTCRFDESVSVAIKKLVANNIGALAIVDANDRLVGIFSERDILRLVSITPTALAGFKISDYMTRHVLSGHPDDNVDETQTIMHSSRIRHLPVLNNEAKLVGIISQGDLTKARLDNAEFHNMQMEGLVMGRYPA